MLRERFEELTKKLSIMGDDMLLESVKFAIDSCGNYVEAVNAMEAVLTVQRFRLEPDEFREAVSEADKRRRNIHNGLIANVTILNRVCVMAEVEKIFQGDTEDRLAIADFAMEVTTEMFATRKL